MNRARLFAFLTLSIATTGLAACGAAASSETADETTDESDLGVKPGQFCGGFAGIACPVGQACIDDPSDSCDPAQGGADCGGICAKKPKCNYGDPTKSYVSKSAEQCAAIKFYCADGVPFFNACGCGCELSAGEACGANVCGTGEYCCNASCGICAPEGGVCTQQACAPAQ